MVVTLRDALRLTLVAAALGCAVAVAGCGGGKAESKDQAGVRQALQRLDRAQATGDAKSACAGLVAVEEQGRIEVPGEDEAVKGADTAEPDADAGGGTDAGGDADAGANADADGGACERAFEQASASRKALRDVSLTVSRVTVRGENATAAVRTELTRPDGSKLAQDGTRRLVRRDGRWRVVITEE